MNFCLNDLKQQTSVLNFHKQTNQNVQTSENFAVEIQLAKELVESNLRI